MLDPIKPAHRSQSLTNCILGVGLTPNAGRRRRTLRPNRLLGPEPRLEGEAAHRAGRRSPDAQFDRVEMSDIRAEDPVELGAERVVAPNAAAFMRSPASQPKSPRENNVAARQSHRTDVNEPRTDASHWSTSINHRQCEAAHTSSRIGELLIP